MIFGEVYQPQHQEETSTRHVASSPPHFKPRQIARSDHRYGSFSRGSAGDLTRRIHRECSGPGRLSHPPGTAPFVGIDLRRSPDLVPTTAQFGPRSMRRVDLIRSGWSPKRRPLDRLRATASSRRRRSAPSTRVGVSPGSSPGSSGIEAAMTCRSRAPKRTSSAPPGSGGSPSRANTSSRAVSASTSGRGEALISRERRRRCMVPKSCDDSGGARHEVQLEY